MNYFIETILDQFPKDIFSDVDVLNLFGGSHDSRYGLVKRALAKSDIVRIRRGLYILAKKYQRFPVQPYSLASLIFGPSYISMESAMSYHGLIPEAVLSITSVCQKGSREFATPFGRFCYTRVPQNIFYTGVERIQNNKQYSFFMASPLKALLDYFYVYKKDWKNLHEAAEDLRLDLNEFSRLNSNDFQVHKAYRNRRVICFLKNIYKELSYEHRLDSRAT